MTGERWAGWQRAGDLWAAELADALGVEAAPLGELVAQAAVMRRQLQLARLELAEAASEQAKALAAAETVTVQQAALMVGVSARTVFDWERDGLALDRTRARAQVFVNLAALARFLAHRRPHYLNSSGLGYYLDAGRAAA